jgi:hypothetical protein
MLDTSATHLIHGLLPRHQVSILAGASGAGKSMLTFQMIGALQRNEPVLGNPAQPNLTIGYIRGDRPIEEARIQAERCGADFSRLKTWSLIDTTDPGHLNTFERNPGALLRTQIQALLPLDLLVVDPLVPFLGVDQNNYNATAARLIRLSHLCREFGITLLGLHHSVKSRKDVVFVRPQDRILGSAALLGYTANHLFLLEPEEEGNAVYQFHVLDHLCGKQLHTFTRLPEDHPTQPGVFQAWSADSPLTSDHGLLTILPDPSQSVTRSFLTEALPALTPGQLDAALRDLLAAGLIQKAGHGRVRRTPGGGGPWH